MTQKLKCAVCDWCGTEDGILTAPNPFDVEELIYGCPACKAVNMLESVCEHEGCWLEVSCGTPTKDGKAVASGADSNGYVMTCWKHSPE